MRTATITMDGEERILCFSTGVVEAACEKYGSLENFFEALNGEQLTQIRTVIWALAAMMDAGAKRAKRKGIPCAEPLSEDEIRDLCDISDLSDLKDKVAETITAGSAREVEAEPPKNGETTLGEEMTDH